MPFSHESADRKYTAGTGLIRNLLIGVVACAVVLSQAAAQTSASGKRTRTDHPIAAPATANSVPERKGPSVADITKLLEGKVGETIIVSQVRKGGTSLELTADQMVALKKAGASDALIEFLLDPAKPYSPPPPPPPPAAAPAPSAAAPPEVRPAPAAAPALDIGVYFKKNGEWAEIRPEVVNWKTGGTMKSLASAGVVKKDLNGNIDGPSSKTSVRMPLEILIVAPEGVSAEEYQFLRLRLTKDYREFRSVTGGILNQRSGAMRDLIPFEAKKIASRNFVVVMPPSVGAGEYGFLPPGAGGSSTTNAVSSQYGKLYSFRIVE